jgi:hypothetical protein
MEKLIPEETCQDSKYERGSKSLMPKILEAKTQNGRVKFTSLWLQNITIPQNQDEPKILR